MLKLDQRKEAIARGIELMEWTFDPLELKNAFFNIERLGVIIRRFVRNQYGITTSVLQGGLPTDRCTAEWWMKTDRVRAAIEGQPFQRPDTELRISVPNDIAKMRDDDQAGARQIQAEVTDRFCEAFDRGFAVVGFERTDAAGNYLLGRWQ
jgi:predicted GNAT superfamily acetyltransferase